MTADLRIRSLRMPEAADPRAVTRTLDLEPREGDRSVLVIRHLVLSWGDAGGAREALARLRRTAARPARDPDGVVDAHAEAVTFDDEAQALMCLSLDVLLGTAGDHWWWRGRLPAGVSTPRRTLISLWRAQPRWVPAVLGPLLADRPARAAEMVVALGDEGCLEVLKAVLEQFSMPGDESPRAHPPTVPGLAPADLAVPAVVIELGSRVSPPARALLAVAAVLDQQPARGRQRGFATWAMTSPGTWLAPAAVATKPLPDVVSPNPGPPSTATRPASDRTGQAPPRPSARQRARPADDSVARDRQRLPVAARMALADLPPEEGDDAPLAPVLPMQRSTGPRPGHDGDSEVDDVDDGTGPPPGHYPPWAGSGPATETGMASMLYAVNLMRWFGLVDGPDGTDAQTRSGWAVVEALARWLLRRLRPQERRRLVHDPLLGLLAELDGRPADVRTTVRLGHDTRPVGRFLDRSGVGPGVFTTPGTLLVSRTHVDVVLPLSDVDLAARRTGLDQDPGWVPELGRIVLFHFEDGA